MIFVLSREAHRDVEGIGRYTKDTWGGGQALLYLEALEARLRQLAESPAMGRSRDEVSSGLLSYPHEQHVIFYVIQEDGIAIVRILHHRQDVDGQLCR